MALARPTGSPDAGPATIAGHMRSLDELRSPLTLEALRYWTRKRSTQPVPHIDHFDPSDMRSLLPHIAVVDVSGSPRVFTYKLIGEAQKNAVGMNLAGVTTAFLDRFHAGLAARINEIHNQICEVKEPCATKGDMAWANRSYRRYEAVHLPYSRDGRDITRIVIVAAYEDVISPDGILHAPR